METERAVSVKPERTEPTPVPTVEPTPSLPPLPSPKAQPENPSTLDIVFISVVWTTEMVYHVVQILLARYTEDYLYAHEPEESREIGTRGWMNMSAIFAVTLLAMLSAGIALQFILFNFVQLRFWMAFGLLSAYFLSCPSGIALAATKVPAVGFVMSWLQISWNVFSPIRFWYIFHQFFPMSVRWSHLIVSGNVLAIGIVEYIAEISVTEADPHVRFSADFFYGAYTITTVAAIGWIVGLFLLRKRPNRVPGDLSSVRRRYEDTEVIEKFDRKQTENNVHVFLALLLPAVMLPIMREFIRAGLKRLPVNAVSLDLNLVRVRPDLLVSLIVIVAVEGALQYLRKIRNELTDVVIIGISQIINVIVVVLFVMIFNSSGKARKVMGETKAANLILINNVMGSFIVDVGNGIKGLVLDSYVEVQVEDVSANMTVRLVISNSATLKPVYDKNIHLERHRSTRAEKRYYVNMYIFRELISSGGFELLRAPLSYINVNDYRPKFFCTQETCTNYNHRITDQLLLYPEITTGVLSKSGKCLPISWQIHLQPDGPHEPNANVSKPFKPPAYDTYVNVTFDIPCGPIYSNYPHSCRPVHVVFHGLAVYFALEYPDEAKKVHDWVGINKCSSGPGVFSVYGLKFFERYGNVTYDLPKLFSLELRLPDPLPEITLLIPLSVYGFSLGTAWVAYVHFMWIQCPTRRRLFIIFAFFSMLYTSSWLSERLFKNYNDVTVLAALAFSVLFALWHLGAMALFALRWYRLRRKGQPQKPWNRF